MNQRTLSELAALCAAELEGDGAQVVAGPAPLAEALEHEVSFLGHPKYTAQLTESRAGAVLVPSDFERPEALVDAEAARDRAPMALLRCAEPARAFDRIVRAFAADLHPLQEGVHPTAHVAEDAVVGAGAWVGPHCVVGSGATLGDGAQLLAHVSIGAGATVGARSLLHPAVVLYPGVRVGADCILHGGAVIGGEGFGFHPTESGWERIPQVGTVVVEDDVEIGSNSTVDRARFGVTRIGRGAKVDNLVHVAHNVDVGEHAMLVAQVGIAGSATVGPRAILGGQVGISDHVNIGAAARVGAASAVFRDVPEGTDYFGCPAGPKRETLRGARRLLQLDDLMREVRQLRRRVEELENVNEAEGQSR